MTSRTVIRVAAANEIAHGPGLRLRRAIPVETVPAVGPFIMLDQVGPRTVEPHNLPSFPAHPHAGIETLTYLLDGSIAHADSAGHTGTIQAGEMQWMRAGRGIIHLEEPGEPLKSRGGRLHGLQLWINLPKGHKQAAPAYRNYGTQDIPAFAAGDASAHLLAGELAHARGPVETFADPFAVHLAFATGGTATLSVPAEDELAVYVLRGQVRMAGGAPATAGMLLNLSLGDNLNIAAYAAADVLVLGGRPLDAPIVRHGPFVMNSSEEIQAVLREYFIGRMGQIPKSGP